MPYGYSLSQVQIAPQVYTCLCQSSQTLNMWLNLRAFLSLVFWGVIRRCTSTKEMRCFLREGLWGMTEILKSGLRTAGRNVGKIDEAKRLCLNPRAARGFLMAYPITRLEGWK